MKPLISYQSSIIKRFLSEKEFEDFHDQYNSSQYRKAGLSVDPNIIAMVRQFLNKELKYQELYEQIGTYAAYKDDSNKKSKIMQRIAVALPHAQE